MRIPVIVQARMTSARLPGKVMEIVEGKPLLEYVLERLKNVKEADGIIVATSDQKSDQPIVNYCQRKKQPCFRGSLTRVAERFRDLIQTWPLDAFVRISADSPWIDPELVDHAVRLFRGGAHDLVTNVWKRTFPKGESVEVVNGATFSKIFPEITTSEDHEHVTKYFYGHSDCFRILNFTNKHPNESEINLCVDTSDDLNRFINILKRLNRPACDYRWNEIVELYQTLDKREQTCLH